MTPLEWVLLAAVVLLLVVVVALVLGMQRRRSMQLQERFGPEYERAVDRSPNRREAEQHLAAVAEQRDRLQIRDLAPAAAERYRSEWHVVQARFVDAPAEAVRSADGLLTTIMRERGYPVDDFDEHASLVAVDYPDVVEHYREGRAGYQRHLDTGNTDTEELRRAFVHYRALFDSLVSPTSDGRHAVPSGDVREDDRSNPYASDLYANGPEVQR
jgi:hypothetical protein